MIGLRECADSGQCKVARKSGAATELEESCQVQNLCALQTFQLGGRPAVVTGRLMRLKSGECTGPSLKVQQTQVQRRPLWGLFQHGLKVRPLAEITLCLLGISPPDVNPEIIKNSVEFGRGCGLGVLSKRTLGGKTATSN